MQNTMIWWEKGFLPHPIGQYCLYPTDFVISGVVFYIYYPD